MDGDGDGVEASADCDDAQRRRSAPARREVFGNGADEDCNGRDDANPDADRDGFAVPADCDDANAAIRPGALEIRGNAVDENCDRRVSPWVAVPAVVTNQWALDGSRTRLRALVVRLAPKGATRDARAAAAARARSSAPCGARSPATSSPCRSRRCSGGRGCAPARA